MSKNNNRFWELDVIRGIAVILMILYHLMFDLAYFAGFPINFTAWYWQVLARYIQVSFLVLVGISLTISFDRLRSHHLTLGEEWTYFFKRGIKIFGAGLIITIFSLFFAPEAPIVFGILHFIGLTIVIALPWLRSDSNWWPLVVVSIVIGIILRFIRVGTNVGLLFGLMPSDYSSLDYFPLLPWFGVVLAGIQLGKKLYTSEQRKFSISEQPNSIIFSLLSWMGQHALLLYILHQPLLWTLVYLLA